MNIGEKIKLKRKDCKISQRELAKILGIPFSTLANYENGHRHPSIEVLQKIAETLKITTAELLDDDSTTKAINNLFDSFITDIICTDKGTNYEIKIPELEPFEIDSEEYHQLENEVIDFIKYKLYQIGKQKEGE